MSLLALLMAYLDFVLRDQCLAVFVVFVGNRARVSIASAQFARLSFYLSISF